MTVKEVVTNIWKELTISSDVYKAIIFQNSAINIGLHNSLEKDNVHAKNQK